MIYCSTETTDQYISLLGGLGTRVPLESGDLFFYGADDNPIWVERKMVYDLCVSMITGRLNSQVRRGHGVSDEMYLIVEGQLRPGEDGLLEVPGGYGRWVPLNVRVDKSKEPLYVDWQRVENYLNSLGVIEGIRVKTARDTRVSAKTVLALYIWWQKGIEEHTSTKRWPRVMAYGGRPGLMRRWLLELDGVGPVTAMEIEGQFKNDVCRLVSACVDDFEKVKGVGRVTAEKIWRQIHGG